MMVGKPPEHFPKEFPLAQVIDAIESRCRPFRCFCAVLTATALSSPRKSPRTTDRYYFMDKPPSAISVAPVTNDASSLASQRIGYAISSGAAQRAEVRCRRALA
jgi:hypothetical protein